MPSPLSHKTSSVSGNLKTGCSDKSRRKYTTAHSQVYPPHPKFPDKSLAYRADMYAGRTLLKAQPGYYVHIIALHVSGLQQLIG